MYKVEVIELNGRGDKVAKAILLEDRDLKTKKDAVAEIVSYVRLHCDRLCRNEYFTYLDVSGWDEVAKKTKKYKGVIEGSTGDVYISRVCKGLDKYFQIAKLEN